MIPQEYNLFCTFKHVIACGYLNTADCKGTCNLAQDSFAQQEAEDSYSAVAEADRTVMNSGLIRFLNKKKHAESLGFKWR